MHPLVRSQQAARPGADRDRDSHGIVLYTLLDGLTERLENTCRELGVPCLSILGPVLALFQALSRPRPSPDRRATRAQRRVLQAIDALKLHHAARRRAALEDLEEADVVLVGVSRTSKTPTSIYLANRGVKTAQCPLVPGDAGAADLESCSSRWWWALRQPGADRADPAEPAARAQAPETTDEYIDRRRCAESRVSRKLCASTTGRSST
jgi:regulator of PEP synthase PpsR (kinase-PPPase family)